MTDAPSRVVAISGVTGSGKTTLANNLAARLPSATVFRLEHYQAAANEAKAREEGGEENFVLHDHAAWSHVDYDPNRMLGELPGLDDLRRLIAGQAVHPPGVRQPIEPARVVLFEDSFARDLHVLDSIIGVALHISMPLDVALCRGLLRFERHGRDPTFWVHNYVDYDLHYFYARLERVQDSADCVLDGMQSAEEVCDAALAFLDGRV